MGKERLTVTVDSELIEAANAAVAEGRAASLSGWVNVAMSEWAARERRLRNLAEAIAAYEHKLGEITAAELEAQKLTDKRHAKPVRARRRKRAEPRTVSSALSKSE